MSQIRWIIEIIFHFMALQFHMFTFSFGLILIGNRMEKRFNILI